MINTTNEIIFYAKTQFVVVLFINTIFAFSVILYFVFGIPPKWSNLPVLNTLETITLLICVSLFGIGSLLSLYKVIKLLIKSPDIEIDNTGILFNASPISHYFVPWKAIGSIRENREISPAKNFKVTSTFYNKSGANILDRSNSFTLLIINTDLIKKYSITPFKSSAVTINPNILNIRDIKLHEVIAEHWGKYK